MIQPIHEMLIAYWTKGGLMISRGCPSDRVRQFETENNVALPADLRGYFLRINGMLPEGGQDSDVNGFCFWPLSKVRSVAEETVRHSLTMPKSVEDHQYFVFADYLQWSWAYAIRLAETVDGLNPVIHVGTKKPKIVASSFTQFVDLYLRDAEELYPV